MPSIKKSLAGALAAFAFAAPCAAQFSDDVVKIGLVVDLTSLYADVTGQGVVEAMKMAIADAGGSINGKRIEVIAGDYQNKPDIAASKARERIDQERVDLLVAAVNSSAALALSRVAHEKKQPLLVVSTGTTRPTDQECNPYTK